MKKYLLCLSLVLSSVMTFADSLKGHRVLFLLDGSSSMSVPYAKGQTRFEKGAATILSIMDSISAKEKDVEFALRVYGHQHPAQEKNCFDTKMEVPFSKANRAQMELRLDNLKPAGISPLSYAIHEAVLNDLQKGYGYSVFIISDGDESCGKNICEEAIHMNTKYEAIPTFIDLGSYNEKVKSLTCIRYRALSLGKIILEAQKKDTINTQSITEHINENNSRGYILITDISNPKHLMVYQKKNGIKVSLSNSEVNQLRGGMQVEVKTGKYTIEYLSHDKKTKTTDLTVINEMITNVSLK